MKSKPARIPRLSTASNIPFMRIAVLPEDLRSAVSQWRSESRRVAFVPTMGNLHAGHASLIRRARELADVVIVSVFVNPLQFGPKEDFAAYPRTPDEDRALLESLNVDLLFTPEVADIYPLGQEASVRVHVPGLEDILCGAFRPGHFMGVATVVTKLLNLVAPQVAIFGEKDFQQLMIIRRAANDLCMPIDIVGVSTTRELDGLAMSSRNRYLTAEQRALAPRIFAELEKARIAIERGDRNYSALEAAGTQALNDTGFRTDYFAVRDARTLEMPNESHKDLVVLTAARIGRARLIDNVRARRA
jgi:pantoate--beta-alanine ligase